MTIPFTYQLTPPFTDEWVRLASTALPGDFGSHGSDGTLAYSSVRLTPGVGHLIFRMAPLFRIVRWGGRPSSLETDVVGPQISSYVSLSQKMDLFGLAHSLLTRLPRIPCKIHVSFGLKPYLHLLKEREPLYSVGGCWQVRDQ